MGFIEPEDKYRIRTTPKQSYAEYCKQRDKETAEIKPLLRVIAIFGVIGFVIGFCLSDDLGFRYRMAADSILATAVIFAGIGAVIGMTVYGLFEIVKKYILKK